MAYNVVVNPPGSISVRVGSATQPRIASTSTFSGAITAAQQAQIDNASTVSNTAYSLASSVYGVANTAYVFASSAFDEANTSYSLANSVSSTANTAVNYANSAYTLANTALPATGGTITGTIVPNSNTINLGSSTNPFGIFYGTIDGGNNSF